jgi:hypothetical protein
MPETTESTEQPPVRSVRIGTREYEVAEDGWCDRLGCWIVRNPTTGRLVSIPHSWA